jgi:ribulose-bisphosphate carboxylase large chain
MHPGLVEYINETLSSVDWMANVGGAMHGHPMGTRAGALAMKQSINGDLEGEEYLTAIEKWGKRKFSPDLDYRIF